MVEKRWWSLYVLMPWKLCSWCGVRWQHHWQYLMLRRNRINWRCPALGAFGNIHCLHTILLMEEILHQLIGVYPIISRVSYIPRWCRISSINSRIHGTGTLTIPKFNIWTWHSGIGDLYFRTIIYRWTRLNLGEYLHLVNCSSAFM